MPITIESVHSQKDLFRYVQFAWKIYKDDQAWVPPLINDMVSRLDPAKNPFWKTATRMLWIAYKDGQPAGTITAIYDRHLCQVLNQKVGTFGFFECIHDQGVADLLFSTAADWLCLQGMTVMRGPYNPGPSDEVGILTEGFEIRPTVMTGHHPPYYASLFENGGFERHWQCVARMLSIPPDCKTIEEFVPEKILRIAEKTRQRTDLTIRPMNIRRWDQEIEIACDIFNRALSHLKDYVPTPLDEFKALASGFKQIMDPEMALLAEVDGKPVAFSLGLPDINQALQHINGRLDILSIARLWWFSRRITRLSFKILMVLPEYWGRGIETVLITETAQVLLKKGYREVDASLTGEENDNSNRYQERFGLKVYERYWVYEKPLS